MTVRLLPLIEIDCTADHCGNCAYLAAPTPATAPMPRCGLLTGSLDTDSLGRPFRADECKDAQARVSAADRESDAWRALAIRNSAGYHWMPPRQLTSDAWTTTGSTLLNDAPLPLPPVHGHGDTPGAATIDLATKLGLLK